jgi:uncharacterized protein (DUF2147 family)
MLPITRWSLILLMLLNLGFVNVTYAQNPADGIVGEWLSAKKDSRILIYRQGNIYVGKVSWGTGGSAKDTKNPDPKLRNRDIIGSEILNGFAYKGDNTWDNGTIYDPREGKVYSCKMTLKTPSQLSIRGYIGVSLFGRTEVWSRVK